MAESVKLAHEGQMALVAWEDHICDEAPISSVSEWVLSKIEQLSEVLGLSFEGLEHLSWELFAEL